MIPKPGGWIQIVWGKVFKISVQGHRNLNFKISLDDLGDQLVWEHLMQSVGGDGAGGLGNVPLGTRQSLINCSVMLTFNEHLLSTCYGRVQCQVLGCRNE